LVKDFAVTVNSELKGLGPGITVPSYSPKDGKGEFVVEHVQIEFGHEERQLQREKVILDVSEIVDILNARLAAPRAD
jgi:hypothetical protein